MPDISRSVGEHYGFGGVLERVLEGLKRAGKDIDALSIDDLAPIDEFHTRGRDSTLELTALAQLQPTHQVLDVGCGLGGSARHIACEFECQVTGLDLTQEYVEVANELTRIVGLSDRVHCVQGSALDQPFADDSFDVVWTEHAQMNIEDKERFYAEIGRVLRPGGRLMFHDIFLGATASPWYPVPWAEDASISFLSTEKASQDHMQQAGLSIVHWEDKKAETLQFFELVFQRLNDAGPPPIGIHLLMGDNASEKLQNYVRNVTENRVTVAMGRVDKPAG